MRFLIVKTSSLGDIVQSFDALSYLSAKYPNAKIDWVVEKSYQELLLKHPSVDRVLTIDARNWRKAKGLSEFHTFRRDLQSTVYDAVFDLQGNCKSAWVTYLARSKNKVGFGNKSVREWPAVLVTHHKFNFDPTMNIRKKYLSLLTSYFKDERDLAPVPFLYQITGEQLQSLREICSHAKGTIKVMVCPGSKWENKRLDKECWKQFMESLSEHLDPYYFLMWGSEDERKLAVELHDSFSSSFVVDRVSLPMWQRLMDKMDLVLAVDSSALHLSATTTTPSFSIFGPTQSEVFKPYGKTHKAIQGECPYQKQFVKQCPVLRSCKTGACIKDLQPDAIYEQFNAWWQSASKSTWSSTT